MEDQLNKVKTFYFKYKRLPTFSEMMKMFGFKSKSSVAYIVHRWVYEGILRLEGRLLAPGDEFFRLPLLGIIRAGVPSNEPLYADEGVVLDHYFVQHPGFTYILRVAGDSMIGEGIKPGDLVVIDKKLEPRNGSVVAAFVDGEWTLKYFRKEQERVFLEAANPAYATIHPRASLEIGGVVTTIIREYKN